MINFNPFPVIETKNLILREISNKDIEDLFEMRKNPEMIQYVDSRLDESKEDTRIYMDKMNKGIKDNKWIIWAIEHRGDKKVIGTVSIWNIDAESIGGELGYGITPKYQGRSLMKEALLAAAEYGFNEMKLKYLDAYTEEQNIKSIGLLERCNFILVNKVDDNGYYSKRVYHMRVYRLIYSKPK